MLGLLIDAMAVVRVAVGMPLASVLIMSLAPGLRMPIRIGKHSAILRQRNGAGA